MVHRQEWLLIALRVLLACLFAVLYGCASQPVVPLHPSYSSQLLTGKAIFGQEVPASRVEPVDMLAVSQEMRDFVAQEIGTGRSAVSRFNRLLRLLNERGYFDGAYDPGSVNSAAEAFASKRGNCLSYSSMFAALGREAELNVQFQVVDVPPRWHVEKGLLIRTNHINLIVKTSVIGSGEFTVDFNVVDPEEDAPRRLVSDAYAQSLLYSNIAIDLMKDEQYEPAWAYLRRGIELAPDNADLWVNLGAFYSRFGKLNEARQAYEVVLSLRPRSRTGYAALANLHRELGNEDQSSYYRRFARRYQERNPYYHLAVAQRAYGEERLEESLQAISRAIDLRRTNPSFLYFRGVVERDLGDRRAAERSFAKAARYVKRYNDDVSAGSYDNRGPRQRCPLCPRYRMSQ